MLDTLAEELKETRAFEEQMRKFGGVVTADTAIQQRLSDAVDSGASTDAFCELYVTLASENGIQFTAEQMKIAMQEQKQGSNKILPSFVQKLIAIL